MKISIFQFADIFFFELYFAVFDVFRKRFR